MTKRQNRHVEELPELSSDEMNQVQGGHRAISVKGREPECAGDTVPVDSISLNFGSIKFDG